MKTTAIIVAAGRGVRAGGGTPKQYRDLSGRPVLAHVLDRFATHPGIDAVVLVVHPDDAAAAHAIAGKSLVVFGADTRAGSVAAGLAAVPQGTSHVLIHDGARPCVPASVIDRVLEALRTSPGAAPALAVTDALWRVSDARVVKPRPRDGIFRAQTPQGFDLAAIRRAQESAPASAADDVEVALAAGIDVAVVQGDERNIKITTAQDFDRAARILETQVDIRTGTGFDVHRFAPGSGVTICGVEIPHEFKLSGHSDADVGIHAIADAIYGALADGDIGVHFPPSDPQWKGAASEIFLKHAAGRAAGRGFRISHVDCTIICERPKIGPHAAAMRDRLAGILGIGPDRVSVKATTTETLGFTGRGEGIAAQAIATLVAE